MKEKKKKEEDILTKPILVLVGIVAVLVLFNQFQISSAKNMISSDSSSSGFFASKSISLFEKNDLENLNIDEIKSTPHTLAAVFPVEKIKNEEDAMAILFPTGTPEYGDDLGVSFDKPIESLEKLARMYPNLKVEVEKNDPESWNRFMNLASKPVGISCEYCCGLGAVGIDKKGNSACGCQHNPALLTVALYLSAYSDYSDGEILREVMKWKTLFFPRDMIEQGMVVAGGDTSKLDNLPGMVGGC